MVWLRRRSLWRQVGHSMSRGHTLRNPLRLAIRQPTLTISPLRCASAGLALYFWFFVRGSFCISNPDAFSEIRTPLARCAFSFGMLRIGNQLMFEAYRYRWGIESEALRAVVKPLGQPVRNPAARFVERGLGGSWFENC
jgi:hypothetical protein